MGSGAAACEAGGGSVGDVGGWGEFKGAKKAGCVGVKREVLYMG